MGGHGHGAHLSLDYAQLAEALKGLDIHETERNLNNKISPGRLHGRILPAMLGSNRNDRGALVALALILGAVIVFAVLEVRARQSLDHQVRRDNPANIDQNSNGNVPQVVSGGGDFDFWRDPFPQWVMAIFTVMATGISLYAIRLVRATWQTTDRTANAAIEANRTAREIGEAQVRAYLTCTGAEFVVNDKIAYLNVFIRNAGQSPSLGGQLKGSLVFPDIERGGLIQIEAPAAGFVGAIAAGDQHSAPLLFPEGRIRDDLLFNARLGGFPISCSCDLTWRDVFEGDGSLSFLLTEKTDSTEPPPEGTRRGAMTVSSLRRTGHRQNGER